jgi:NCAIR mutase (PurE)-related protein
LKAKAALNWNGQLPQIVAGSDISTGLVIPVPGTTGYGATK